MKLPDKVFISGTLDVEFLNKYASYVFAYFERKFPEDVAYVPASEAERLREALERIARFNPSYEYTFENARRIAREALGGGARG